jgi:PilZ domain-containing protein
MGRENRRSPRRDICQFAVVHGGDDRPLRPCFVRNVSATGANIGMESASDVPDEFILILTRGGDVRRRCRIVWRSEKALGVRFLNG